MRAAILLSTLLSVSITLVVSGCGLPADSAGHSEHALLAGAPCTATATTVDCTYEHRDLPVDLLKIIKRRVYFQQPQGTPPLGGWPVVLLFQGTFFSAELSFHGVKGEPFGAYYQALTVKQLLDAGFAVVAPQTHLAGTTFWDSNIPPWSVAWELSPDHSFMLAIFDAIEGGKLGVLNPFRLYAAGISSGGYMTSRMAVSYQGRFKALAIASASYATCGGPLCIVPALPANHPPTLFLHGQQDPIVPVWTMDLYHTRLVAEGHKTRVILHDPASHEWIPESPDAVVDWFVAAP